MNQTLIYEHNYAFDASALGLNNPDGYALLSQPAPVLNFLSSILGVPLPTDAVIATKPFETAANLKPVNENVSDSFTGILDVDLSDSVKLKNTVNYRSDTNDFKADADLSDKTLVHVGGLVYYKTFSEEITLNGKSGGLDWVLGGYYFNNKFSEGASSNIIFGAPLLGTPQKVQTQTLAAFADATYEITPGLYFSAGARYSSEQRKFEQHDELTGALVGTKEQKRWNSLTPRAAIRFEFDRNTNVYVSYSKGYKSGTFAGTPPVLVNPEHMDAYEVGFKHSSPTFSVNAAAFLYNYRDFQVSAVDILNNRTTAVNAELQRNKGAELEMTFRPVPALQISLAGAYLDAKFIRFDNAPLFVKDGFGGWSTIASNAAGTRAPRSPEWSGNAAISYDVDVKSGIVQLSANVSANSVVYNVVNEQFPVPGYAEVGANISYTTNDKHWRAELFVTNLTDHKRPQQLQGGPVGTYAIWAPPRIFGGSISYSF